MGLDSLIRSYLAENWDHKKKTIEDLAWEIQKAIVPAYILEHQLCPLCEKPAVDFDTTDYDWAPPNEKFNGRHYHYICPDHGNWCPFGERE